MFHVVIFLALPALFGSFGIQITDLRVPAAVRNDSGSPALLDCEYSAKPEEEGLVVKWYFNNSPSPVYQWIPGQKPQDLGVLRGRLDLGYRASNHKLYVHRALYIRNPTTDLSGDYKCLVSTFNDEDFMVKRMIVFAPEQALQLSWSTFRNKLLNLSCKSWGVYPTPEMKLYVDSLLSEAVPGTVVRTTRRKGSYEISASKVLDVMEVESPSMLHCELLLPEANYVVKKSLMYYQGFSFPISDLATGLSSCSPWLPVLIWGLLW